MAKFNEEICKELCELHSEGLPQKSCADIVGINRRTLWDWLTKGKNAKSGKYRNFYIQWCKAGALYEREHLNHISDSPSWLAHQYLLQVKDPETYVVAEKQQIEAETKSTIAADVDMNNPQIRENDLNMLKELIRDKNGS